MHDWHSPRVSTKPPACQVPEHADRIAEFPTDGRLWWIRWVDGYSVQEGRTATPSVEVVLSPLDVPLSGLRDLDLKAAFRDNSTHEPIRVFTGYIPRLAIGMVFQNGVEVGRLPLEATKFDSELVELSTNAVMDKLPTNPNWWNHPYRVINRTDLYLGPHCTSYAVVAQTREATVVLPCHEVFRTMYAPDTDIAIALTSGPWEHTQTKVVDPQMTGIRPDGSWQIKLRRRIRNECAPSLANLCLSYAGRHAANSIFTGLLKNEGRGLIEAPIPFGISRLKIEAKGVWLAGDPPKFLALQIGGMTWPIDAEIFFTRDNSGDKGEVQIPIDRPRPYSGSTSNPSPDEDGFIKANSQEDPSAESDPTKYPLPTFRWEQLPRLKKTRKPESFQYQGDQFATEETALDGVSAGTTFSGDTQSGAAIYTITDRSGNDRFTAVAEMLDRLQQAKEIVAWRPVPHPRPRLVVGGHPAWHFPTDPEKCLGSLAFSYVSRRERQVRGALVCEINTGAHHVYWLEVETRTKNGGVKSLLFGAPRSSLTTTVQNALSLAANNRGVWPAPDALITQLDATHAAPWRHSYLKRPEETPAIRLNEKRALNAIKVVADSL